MIIIDYKDKRPIFEQVTEKLKKLICSGALEPETRLPSVRGLAVELAINPNTIARSYHELENEGYIYTVKGKGCFVAPREEIARLKNDEYLKQLKKVISEGRGQGFSGEEIKVLFEKAAKEDNS
ncbi:MAG: GntR family transcriptional regulator [Clostridiales bacterium]|nr:GntR family transcriptional regulator [Clostridiales bacterium]MCD8215983.1 GntR family transcriptional regulator [Clostridiales bacterium]